MEILMPFDIPLTGIYDTRESRFTLAWCKTTAYLFTKSNIKDVLRGVTYLNANII